jgi:hypothetical protein
VTKVDPDPSEPQPETNEDPTEKVLRECYESEYPNGWVTVFKTESDYDYFIRVFGCFFRLEPTDKDFSVQMKRMKKTGLASVLKAFYNELGQTNLRSNKEYFDLIRGLSEFKDATDNQIYKTLNH